MDLEDCSSETTKTGEDSPASQSQSTAPCHLCSSGFRLQPLHLCKFCGLPVCSTHSMRRRPFSEQVTMARICDQCHKDIIGAGVKGEKKAALKCLRKQLQADLSKYEQVCTEIERKKEEIEENQSKLTLQIMKKDTKITDFARKLEEKKGKTEEKRREVREKDEETGVLRQKVRGKDEEMRTKQAEISLITSEIAQLSSQIQEQEANITQLTHRLQRQMNKSQALSIFCPVCNPKFQHLMVGTEMDRSKIRKARQPSSEACKKCVCM